MENAPKFEAWIEYTPDGAQASYRVIGLSHMEGATKPFGTIPDALRWFDAQALRCSSRILLSIARPHSCCPPLHPGAPRKSAPPHFKRPE
jgi:hypothetical protein